MASDLDYANAEDDRDIGGRGAPGDAVCEAPGQVARGEDGKRLALAAQRREELCKGGGRLAHAQVACRRALTHRRCLQACNSLELLHGAHEHAEEGRREARHGSDLVHDFSASPDLGIDRWRGLLGSGDCRTGAGGVSGYHLLNSTDVADGGRRVAGAGVGHAR